MTAFHTITSLHTSNSQIFTFIIPLPRGEQATGKWREKDNTSDKMLLMLMWTYPRQSSPLSAFPPCSRPGASAWSSLSYSLSPPALREVLYSYIRGQLKWAPLLVDCDVAVVNDIRSTHINSLANILLVYVSSIFGDLKYRKHML